MSQTMLPSTETTSYAPRQYAIFDWDGTIADTPQLFFLAHQQLAEERGLNFGSNDQKRLVNSLGKGRRSIDVFSEIIGISKKERRNSTFLDDFENKRKVTFNRLLADPPVEIIKPGAIELMSLFQERDIPVAISTTSGWEQLSIVFDSRANVSVENFSVIVTGDQVSEYVANRDKVLINNAMIERLSQSVGKVVSPRDCMMFEDTVSGVSAARRAGFGLVVAVPDDQTRERALSPTHLSTPHSKNKNNVFGFGEAHLIADSLDYLAKIWKK